MKNAVVLECWRVLFLNINMYIQLSNSGFRICTVFEYKQIDEILLIPMFVWRWIQKAEFLRIMTNCMYMFVLENSIFQHSCTIAFFILSTYCDVPGMYQYVLGMYFYKICYTADVHVHTRYVLVHTRYVLVHTRYVLVHTMLCINLKNEPCITGFQEGTHHSTQGQ